jgi:hypothetical protein
MKTTALTLFAIGFSIVSPVDCDGQVIDPANGHYYQVVTAPSSISWNDARNAAAAMSYLGYTGHLATITSAAENGFLVSTFSGSLLAGKDLGGFQPPGSPEPAGGWTWITGEPWTFVNWAPGEPNNGGGAFSYENGLQFAWATTDGTWNDIQDAATGLPQFSGYVVEFERVPEPAAGWLLLTGGVATIAFHRKRNGG